MSLMQKKVILIVAGFLILLATFFFLFQKNQEAVEKLEKESRGFQNQVNYFTSMQAEVNIMNETAPAWRETIDTITDKFPSRLPQEKAIYNVYKIMSASGIRITGVSPSNAQTFLKEGQFVQTDSSDTAPVSGSAVEQNPESKVELDEMVGKDTVYVIQLTGSLNKIMKAIDWIAKSGEAMSVTNLNLSYDSSTGKLSGGMTLNFFEMNGNGKAYVEPDISSIAIGKDGINKIFGTSKK